MEALHAWDNFYVIVGSAAGALIGLQFVVMTLIADRPQAGVGEAAAAFGTPTVVHFGCCLLISALVNVPWPDMSTGSITGGVVGLLGLIYMVLIFLASITHAREALFGVGVTTLLLLFIGIHNAWDAVAWQVFVVRQRDVEK